MIEVARTLWLVRHGETTWNAERRWQGSRDIPLSPRGVEQARLLATRLESIPFAAAFSSSLQRASTTAEIAAAGRVLVTLEPRLAELSYGAWEGKKDEDIWRRFPEERARWWEVPDEAQIEDAESIGQLQERAWAGLVASLDAEGHTLVVAHGGTNRALLGRILGQPLRAFWRLAQDPCAVNIVELPPGPAEQALVRARIRVINDTSHLR